jgi:flagellar hook-basal body complex protein FliE
MITPVRFPSIPSIEMPKSREITTVGNTPSVGATQPTGSPNFSQALGQALASVDGQIKGADQNMSAFLNGQSDIHEMALSLEQADLSLRLITRVRNRLIEAYREISRMSI